MVLHTRCCTLQSGTCVKDIGTHTSTSSLGGSRVSTSALSRRRTNAPSSSPTCWITWWSSKPRVWSASRACIEYECIEYGCIDYACRVGVRRI